MTAIDTDIHVGILEDDNEMRDWLVTLLGGTANIVVCFAAGTIEAAKAATADLDRLDVCLVDIQLPDGLGTEFIKFITDGTESRALILTVLGDKVSVMTGLEAGADGYLLKDSPPEHIVQSIYDVMDGANPMSAQATSHLFALIKQARTQEVAPTPSQLTARETETLTLFAKGMSYKETAHALDISSHTVREYVKSIYSKLAVHSRSEAVFEAVKLGWIDF